MNKKGFTLIELLAVIVILAIIALITTPIVLNLINQSKEAANKRSVEAYAKAVEYAVAQYEYNNNGELPANFDTIKDSVEYSNSDVKCNVAINCDSKGSVELTGCQVGNYTNHYYKYSSMKGNKGATVDDTNPAHTGDSSTVVACSGGSSSTTNPYETDFSGTYEYMTMGSSDWEELNSSWNAYLRKNTSTNKVDVCKVLSGGVVCLESNMWDCNEQSDGHCVNSTGYVESKKAEFEEKGATCVLSSGNLVCNDASSFDCRINNDGYVHCNAPYVICSINNSGTPSCQY